MRDGVLFGVERRQRWTDEAKLAILGEVGVNGWTVLDVAQRHDVARPQLYQWRREMRRKGLWPTPARRWPSGATTTTTSGRIPRSAA